MRISESWSGHFRQEWAPVGIHERARRSRTGKVTDHIETHLESRNVSPRLGGSGVRILLTGYTGTMDRLECPREAQW
jgi:hypothetical protein